MGSLSRGSKQINTPCIGYESLSIGSAAAVGLASIPTGAKSAIFSVEADSTITDPLSVIRISESSGTVPTSTVGVKLSNAAIWEIPGNLSSFKAIGIEGGKTHTIKVEYY